MAPTVPEYNAEGLFLLIPRKDKGNMHTPTMRPRSRPTDSLHCVNLGVINGPGRERFHFGLQYWRFYESTTARAEYKCTDRRISRDETKKMNCSPGKELSQVVSVVGKKRGIESVLSTLTQSAGSLCNLDSEVAITTISFVLLTTCTRQRMQRVTRASRYVCRLSLCTIVPIHVRRK